MNRIRESTYTVFARYDTSTNITWGPVLKSLKRQKIYNVNVNYHTRGHCTSEKATRIGTHTFWLHSSSLLSSLSLSRFRRCACLIVLFSSEWALCIQPSWTTWRTVSSGLVYKTAEAQVPDHFWIETKQCTGRTKTAGGNTWSFLPLLWALCINTHLVFHDCINMTSGLGLAGTGGRHTCSTSSFVVFASACVVQTWKRRRMLSTFFVPSFT